HRAVCLTPAHEGVDQLEPYRNVRGRDTECLAELILVATSGGGVTCPLLGVQLGERVQDVRVARCIVAKLLERRVRLRCAARDGIQLRHHQADVDVRWVYRARAAQLGLRVRVARAPQIRE